VLFIGDSAPVSAIAIAPQRSIHANVRTGAVASSRPARSRPVRPGRPGPGPAVCPAHRTRRRRNAKTQQTLGAALCNMQRRPSADRINLRRFTCTLSADPIRCVCVRVSVCNVGERLNELSWVWHERCHGRQPGLHCRLLTVVLTHALACGRLS